MSSDLKCPYCAGAGEVSGMVDDVESLSVCPCSGGGEESVRWLLEVDQGLPPYEGFINWQDVPSHRTAVLQAA